MGTIALVAQIYLPCRFGNKISEQNANLINRIYNSNWLEIISVPKYGRRFQDAMLILMKCTQKTCEVKVGYLFPLNLSVFTSVSIRFYFMNYVCMC